MPYFLPGPRDQSLGIAKEEGYVDGENELTYQDWCPESFDAGVLLNNRTTVVFRRRKLYYLGDNLGITGNPIQISHKFRYKKVDAAYVRPTDQRLILFTERK